MGFEGLHGERVTLRPLEVSDVPQLARIAAEPEVARWWLGLDEQDLLEKAGADEDAFVLAVELDGEVIGLVEANEETDPDYRHANIDIFLTTAVHGRGLGADTVPDACPLAHRGARTSPPHHRPGRRQRAGDPVLRAGRVPPGGSHAPV